jgi:predicted transposase YdaD
MIMSFSERYTAAGRAEGLAEGEGRGQSQRAIIIARNMKAADMDYQFISEMTGLTVEEVENA